MKKNFKYISLVSILVFCLAAIAFGQETTGTLEITTKDSTGAFVPNVPITVTAAVNSNTAGYKRSFTTDDQGFQRVLQIPPGTYTITAVATSGFAENTVNNISVVLGKITPVNLELTIVGAQAVVNVSSAEAPIDTTDTKIQTNITSEDAELLPKGVSFSTLLKIAPAVRPEPKSGGFQIDGASGSENTYIVDGHEVTNAVSGTLDGNSDLPFQLVKEIQVKSSGFEAEYGGATGGVVNVVTKGGNNTFSGEFGTSFTPSQFSAKPRQLLALTNNGAEYFYYGGDESLGFFPTANLSGPIVKNHAWFFGSFTPQIFTRDRTINYRTGLAPATYRQKTTYEYGFARIDAQPFSSVRATATYTWNPIHQEGEVPLLSSLVEGSYPQGNGFFGNDSQEAVAYTDQLGGRQNSNLVTGQLVWTPTSNLVLLGRYGRDFLNAKLGTYGREPSYPYAPSNTRIICSTGGLMPPPSAGCDLGDSNGIGLYSATAYDATTRTTVDGEATYIASFGGRHEFKGGYQYNRIFNTVNSLTNPYLILRYGRPINVYSGRNVTPTAPICNEGQTTDCVLGTGQAYRYGAIGEASSTNTGVFFQDKWQPTRRLTLNLGLRAENETVPSFNEFTGIKFGWKDKLAPRIGVAYDLTGDGKTKISGFYGWFYDRFKYELPRGSFGGNIYFSDYFEILPSDGVFTNLNFADIVGGQNPPRTVGGSCPQTGTVFGRIRCSIDRRVPSNDPSLDVATQGGIDPNIKAYRQTETTFTFERELNSKFVLAARYTRKHLDRAIEDAGFITPNGSEAYIIGNPGIGLVKDFYESQGFIPRKAVRNYDAFEIRLDRRFADDYYFNLNYTYSRLYGNYSGLASSDEEGRTDPNVSRAFDAPFTEAVVADGSNTLGRLATDRPHSLKFAGAYSLDWNKHFGFGSNNTTEFSTFFTAQSGTPITTFADVAGYNSIILNGRGDLGRTERFTQTDFAIRHRYRFGRDNRFTMVADLDITNLFNQASVTNRYNLISQNSFPLDDPAYGLITEEEAASDFAFALAERRFQANGAPLILAAANALTTLDEDGNVVQNREPRFNLPNGFQAGRTVRFGFRLIF